MPAKNFIKENFVLIVGLALPVLLMVAFMLASSLPEQVSDPPKYDLVFALTEYPSVAGGIPVNVNLVVKDGVLKAQYTKVVTSTGSYPNNTWKKLYLYQHDSRTVKELTFGFPDDMSKIDPSREDTVEATKGMQLDTTLQSPDGYELTTESYSGRSGLFGDLLWSGGGYSNTPVLKKDDKRVKLSAGSGTNFAYATPEFVGWVTGKN
jgi:hypothetical protein